MNQPFVHTKETPVSETTADASADDIRPNRPTPSIHSTWSHDRERARRAIHAIAGDASRLLRFDLCCANPLVLRSKSEPKTIRLAPIRCHDRLCRPCQRLRGLAVATNLAALVSDRTARLVTLTLAADGKTLRDRLNRLYRSYRKLRSTTLWKERVDGAVALCELKRNLQTGNWHVHLHVLTVGKFVPKNDLAKAWQKLTGDSYVVDVRLIKTANDAAHYLTKYLEKATDTDTFRDPSSLTEIAATMRGRRSIIATGCFKNCHLSEREPDAEWEILGDVATFDRKGDLKLWQRDQILNAIVAWRSNPNLDAITLADDPTTEWCLANADIPP